MASLRLALKASMEASMEDKKPAAPARPPQKTPRPDKDREREASSKTPRDREPSAVKAGKPSSGTSTALAELSAFKAPRKNSRLSDTHSVASEDSARGSVHSVGSQRRLSADDTTPIKAPSSASRKRNIEAFMEGSEKEITESPIKKITPVKPAVLPKKDSSDRLVDSDGDIAGPLIDLGAAESTDTSTPASAPVNNTPALPSVPDTELGEEEKDTENADIKPRHSVGGSDTAAAGGESGDEGEAAAVQPGEESTPRNKRAAAVMAKTKLNTRKHLDEKELEKELISAGITIAAEVEGEVEEGGPDDGNRRGSKSAKKSGARSGRQAQEVTSEPPPAEEDKFACCDLCEKWRKLPQHVDTTTLPEQWNCSMNIWDPERNTCDAPEETFAEPNKTPIEEGVELFGVEAVTKSKSHSRRSGGKKRRAEPGEEDDEDADGRKKVNKLRMSLDAQGKSPRSDLGTPLVPEQWVQCDKCTKWRKVAPGIDPEDLPKVWYCTMNTWNPLVARCGARQEKSQEKNASGGDDFVPPAGRGKYVRRQNDKPETVGTPMAAPAAVVLGLPGQPVKKVTQWVQCERKNCQKWRKVGANIDMESLPEKWFCEMNTWDYDRATCDAPEEDASDTEGAGASGISTQLIIGNSKGANALSYRRLLFSQDGRLRPIYSEKNKYGHGIFSYSEVHNANDADEYVAPTRSVGYWWSSLYDDAMGAGYSTGSKRHPTVSDPGAKKNPNTAKDLDVLRDSARQREFEIVDGISVVSKRELWPPIIAQEPMPEVDPVGDVPHGSFHLINAYRRMHRMQCPVEARATNAVLAKNIARRSRMSIQDVIRTESHIVKSCISGSYREGEGSNQTCTAADGSGNISISSIWSTVQSARFLNANEEACRACLSASSLKTVIRRLEEDDYLKVVFSGDGELCINILQPLSAVIQARKMKQNCKELRSAAEKSKSEVTVPADNTKHVDPTFGTPYYWGCCGEKERLPQPAAPEQKSDLENTDEKDVAGSVDMETDDCVKVPAVLEEPVKRQLLVYGAERPPLKLRKLLKSHYCTTKTEKEK